MTLQRTQKTRTNTKINVLESTGSPIKNLSVVTYQTSPQNATAQTIKIIGNAIKNGSKYFPIRQLSASIAAKAGPKDYIGQLKLIWKWFISNWRYIKDPDGTELLHSGPKAIFAIILGHGGKKLGIGDCDDSTMAIGSMLKSIGYPIRIRTSSSKSQRGPFFGHVFCQAYCPNIGWITVDPVIWPNAGLGSICNFDKLGTWDLNGKLIGLYNIHPKDFLKYNHQQ